MKYLKNTNTLRKSLIIAVSGILLAVMTTFVKAEANDSDPLDGQMKINQWALTHSTDEQIRIETATELLKLDSPEPRKILLDALAAKDNTAACDSVCKALSQFRSFSQLIPNKQDFLEPLSEIIKNASPQTAQLAAQASLIFDYKQIDGYLKKIIADDAVPAAAKKNAIYALQIRPDKEAVSLLIELLENNNAEVAAAAGDALQQWLPVGNDKQLWKKILKDLESKSRTELLRERLLADQDKIRSLNSQMDIWQKRYISALDTIYQLTADNDAKAKFIAENLSFDNSTIKLWAIEKINMWRKSGAVLNTALLEKPLIVLIGDPEPAVRLETARLLGTLTNINSAPKLLAQLKTEKNPKVKPELLTSLGHVCNFALSPGAEIKIKPEIRIETLNAAADELQSGNPAVAAEVIRNLLLQNGLEDKVVRPYFEMIAKTYSTSTDDKVRLRLLEEASRLCGGDSFYKTIAAEVFGNLFKTATDDDNIQIVTAAVIGYVKSDQLTAFNYLKAKGFTRHSAERIVDELIAIAAQIGTADDLEWLDAIYAKSESPEQKQKAEQAMTAIFQHCKADVLYAWSDKLANRAKNSKNELFTNWVESLYDSAEKKAAADKNDKLLYKIRMSTAGFYKSIEAYPKAAKYYGILIQSTADANQTGGLTADLLDVHLKDDQIDSAKQIISNILLSADISSSDKIGVVLDGYFNSANKENIKKIYTALNTIKIKPELQRPRWQGMLARWQSLIAPPKVETPADSNS